MSESNNESVYVVILTESGDSYTDEGVKYVSNHIHEKFNEMRDLIFMMGPRYNNKQTLKNLLINNPDSYVVISKATSIDYGFGERFVNTMIKWLTEYDAMDKDMTSWEMLRIESEKPS